VCVTFDDGYANNLHLALPVLRRYGVPATIHLATHYVECGDFYPFDRIRLAGRPEATYKDRTIDACLADAASWWPKVRARLTREQVLTLRPLRRDELALFDRSLVDFGAHTHTHCILSHETRERRRAEIRRSVELVREWTGGAPSFSYPNGRADDFDGGDKDALRELGVCAALSCGRHANPPGADLLDLGRYPVGLHHDAAAFRFELSGLRALLARCRPGRPHARVAVRTSREPARVAGAPVPIPNGAAARASPSFGDHR
jgi:peptidoglycan/xylan/chitin deacetylase (PgdA/CDA1 family)